MYGLIAESRKKIENKNCNVLKIKEKIVFQNISLENK